MGFTLTHVLPPPPMCAVSVSVYMHARGGQRSQCVSSAVLVHFVLLRQGLLLNLEFINLVRLAGRPQESSSLCHSYTLLFIRVVEIQIQVLMLK